jgi:hypothetical protein
MPDEKLYRIKGLEWVEVGRLDWLADAGDWRYRIAKSFVNEEYHWWTSGIAPIVAASLASAQLAADAHYRARMERGLVEVEA